MNSHFSGAGSSAIFARDEDMDFDMDQPSAYLNAPAAQHVPHDSSLVDQNSAEYPIQFPSHWPPMNPQYQHHASHQRQISSETQSSFSSNVRSSDDSIFSQFHVRDSIASTSTAWSHVSEPSRDHYISQTGRSLGFSSPIEYQSAPSPIEEPPQPPPTRRVAQRQPAQEKEPFATCVSRTKRSRRSNKEPKYWCTSCGEPFGEKYDWKRHEETYQERCEMFECDLCKNVYFLDKDFIHHHQKGHRCKTCAENQHVESARRTRKTRTGWGCGFCKHFDSDWSARCNHIARHFEKDCKTMGDWHHSQVIYSLLRRPEIRVEWQAILASKRLHNPYFGWNQHTTGRVEGYPESNPNAQLQDLLEYFTPGQDASAIARLAFEKGLRQKELPAPPVPPKDSHSHDSAILRELTHDTQQWTRLLNTINEDDVAASGVTELDFDELNYAFSFN